MESFKKVLEALLVVLALLFSFYYTEKAVIILESNDPIMKEIKENGKSKEEEAIDDKVVDNTLIPGYNGLKINLE